METLINLNAGWHEAQDPVIEEERAESNRLRGAAAKQGLSVLLLGEIEGPSRGQRPDARVPDACPEGFATADDEHNRRRFATGWVGADLLVQSRERLHAILWSSDRPKIVVNHALSRFSPASHASSPVRENDDLTVYMREMDCAVLVGRGWDYSNRDTGDRR